MSDPFDVLRSERDDPVVPEVRTITSRASAIERRRRTALGAGLAGVAAIAVLSVVLVAGPGRPTDTLAQRESLTTSDDAAGADADALADAPAPDPAGVEVAPGAALKGAPAPVEDQATSGTSSGTAGSTTAAHGYSVKESSPELTAEVAVRESTIPRGAEFTLKVCNTTDANVSRSFGSSQRYDFEVKDGARVVWRWSDDMTFAQVVGDETWKPKECKTWTESWDGTNQSGIVQSGNYDAVGILKSSEELRSKASPFCLRPC